MNVYVTLGLVRLAVMAACTQVSLSLSKALAATGSSTDLRQAAGLLRLRREDRGCGGQAGDGGRATAQDSGGVLIYYSTPPCKV